MPYVVAAFKVLAVSAGIVGTVYVAEEISSSKPSNSSAGSLSTSGVSSGGAPMGPPDPNKKKDPNRVTKRGKIEIKTGHIFDKAEHGWAKYGGESSENLKMIENLANKYKSRVGSNESIVDIFEINGRQFKFSGYKYTNGTFQVSDAYYLN